MSVKMDLVTIEDLKLDKLKKVGDDLADELSTTVNKRTGLLSRSFLCDIENGRIVVGATGEHARVIHLLENGTKRSRAYPFFGKAVAKFRGKFEEATIEIVEDSLK